MSDFDFDEIDKAVNGALGAFDGASSHAAATDSVESAKPVVTPSVAAEPVKSAVTDRGSLAPAARRSSGRFMDVVHPSSDMRTATRPTSSEQKTTFTAPTAQVVEKNEDTEDWAKPLESPFLPDAKVEKRPLGGIPVEPLELLEAPEEELMLEAPDDPQLDAHIMPDPIDFVAQTSALSSENEDTSSATTEATTVEETTSSKDFIKEASPEIAPEEDATPEPEELVTPDINSDEEVPSGPTSITQQYTEQPSSNVESGAIYDTENYHQPLAHPEQKRGGAWTVIWIILLVILGAGAGVAFYLFVLPML